MKRNNPRIKRAFLGGETCFIFVIIVLLSNACNEIKVDNNIGDGGLITENPCSPPCFLGVIPDVTSKPQAVEILKQQGFGDYKQFDNIISYGNSIDIKYDSNEYVNVISFAPTATLEVEAIIEKYGPPDIVEVISDMLSTPEHNHLRMGFFYNKLLTYIRLETQETFSAYSLGETIKVNRIVYFNKSAYENAKTVSKHSVQWKGYGLYVDPAP
jgi:hypothetical protein